MTGDNWQPKVTEGTVDIVQDKVNRHLLECYINGAINGSSPPRQITFCFLLHSHSKGKKMQNPHLTHPDN